MSTETSIAQLVSRGDALMQSVQNIRDEATQQVAAVGAAYQATITNLRQTFYVSSTGLDTALGTTSTAPLRTIQAAVNKVPVGGICDVVLMGDYHMTQNTTLFGQMLVIRSFNSLPYRLTFERFVYSSPSGIGMRGLQSFSLWYGARIALIGLTVAMPALDGSWGAYVADSTASMFRGGNSPLSAGMSVTLFACTLELPSPNPHFSAVVAPTGALELYVALLTTTGGSPLGKFIHTISDTNGTAAKDIPFLVTNLNQV